MKKKTYRKKGYVRCKYLENIGVSPENYGTNFCDKSDHRWKRWKKQRKKYGFDDRETWCLEYTFYQWLYTRLTMYKKIAGKTIDLEWHKVNYTPKGSDESIELTEKQAIDIIRKEAKRMILTEDDTERFNPNIMRLFYDILPFLGW